jgi:hypothetical protein
MGFADWLVLRHAQNSQTARQADLVVSIGH